MNIKDIMSDSFLKVAFNEAINQGYSLQDIVNIYSEVEKEKNLVCLGSFGTCTWSIDNKGLLLIEPKNGKKGVLPDPNNFAYEYPWEGYERDILKVVVKEGVVANKDSSFLFSEFYNCKEMDLSGLDTSKVEDMESMFSNCFALEKINLSKFDISNARNTSHMFSGCSSIKSLDLSSFDAKSVEDATRMFSRCESLEELKVDSNSFRFESAVTPFMFEECNKLKVDSLAIERLLIKPEFKVKTWQPPKPKEFEPQKNHERFER